MFDFLLGNDALSAIIAFILVLIPAVLIHELGHFLVAKSVGITILEFGIGMPPRLAKLFTIGGTDYTINWLPLGGFVRPLGEDMVRQMGDEATAEDRAEAERRGVHKVKAVNEASPLARIFFFAGGAIANFILAFALFTIIALIGLPQDVGGIVSIGYVAPDSVLAQAGVQSQDVIATINGEDFADTADFLSRWNANAGESATLGILRGGDQTPIDLTVVPSTISTEIETHPIALDVAANSPAAAAGVQINDLILSIDGTVLTSYLELQQITAQYLDQEVSLTLWRDGEQIDTLLTPRSNPPSGEGAMGIGIADASLSPALGISFQDGVRRELQPQPLGASMQYSVNRISYVLNTIASIPGQIIHGTADPESLRVTSPLGISQAGGIFLQESIQRNQPGIILEFMALISVALGLTNLLPIPALDGGRILFVLIELVRGRPIAPEREGMVHLVGLALLLSLMVVVLLNDIANPLTNLLR